MAEYAEGDLVKVVKDGREYNGIVMPSRSDKIVLKLKSGYNVGLSLDGADVTLAERSQQPPKPARKTHPRNPGLPNISILSTGGTIASRVDYRTGAVSSQFTADDILDAIPELTDMANFNGHVLSMIFSEDMDAPVWQNLARACHEEIRNGADGIIVTHGTDTLSYTAAALSFMVRSPVPIVLVGAQRSSDRPSSDNAMNMICAAAVATSDIAGVTVVMHGETSDDFCYVHRGTKVRKLHTSMRTAFQSVNVPPIARVDYATRNITPITGYPKRGEQELALMDKMETKCALVKFYPGMSPEIIDYYREKGYRGIVLEGTGLGHVSTAWISTLKKAIDAGMAVVMTSQCINGRICDRVYSTGIDLLNAGVIEGEDMLPETVLVKLMWALGRAKDADELKDIMHKDYAGEIHWRSTL
ncbi:MAG TPA: Glu-tRNA(Gln) amidotransferase subunit GatD [Methanocella sp.]|uniref:Glu-tRNA(Gln) amidotransferase subunit GatD n=1 Tax=Methanocella sp. TaxID=2052833 RepID=UPI002C5707E0|nr:Glu-tRNA(Gln) amidotransferase subunit GatD [Methanocella sp.]HTY91662.1 Glu-tRNA(Gln) amidotransferase subunit GatD [Methanocella sp.]